MFVGGPAAVREQGAQPLRRVRGRLAARAPRASGVADLLVKGRHTGRRLHRQAVLLVAGERRARRRSTPATRATRRCSSSATACATGRQATVPQLDGGVRRPLRRRRRRRHGDRGARDLHPPGRRAVQELHRLAGQLGRHRARQRPERRRRAHEHRGAQVGRQRPAGRAARSPGRAARASSTSSPRRQRPARRTSTATPRSCATRSSPRRRPPRTVISAHCVYPCFSDAPITKVLADRADGARHTIKIPVVLPRQRGARLRPRQHAVPDLHGGRARGGVRERPLGAGGGEGRGRACPAPICSRERSGGAPASASDWLA